jgi:hypothetical protein
MHRRRAAGLVAAMIALAVWATPAAGAPGAVACQAQGATSNSHYDMNGGPSAGGQQIIVFDVAASGTCRAADGTTLPVTLDGSGSVDADCYPQDAGQPDLSLAMHFNRTDPVTGATSTEFDVWFGAVPTPFGPPPDRPYDQYDETTKLVSPMQISDWSGNVPYGAGKIVWPDNSGCGVYDGPLRLAWSQMLR